MHKSRVKKIGIELEGGFEGSDSSPDNCECFLHCECDQCTVCDRCEDHYSECECDECIKCEYCDSTKDECKCKMSDLKRFSSKCDLKYAYDNRFNRQCDIMSNCVGECACECECENFEVTNGKFHEDSSVQIDEICTQGEAISYPVETLNELNRFIEDNIPTYTNSTAGTHIHISTFTDAEYCMLMSKKFNTAFLNALEKWKNAVLPDHIKAELNYRLAGNCVHAKAGIFIPDQQLHKTDYCSERYTFLNYCHDKHSTLECRVFPGFNSAKYAKLAAKFFYEFVDNYLQTHKSKPYQISANLEVE